jgi:hypothetical protein
MNERVCKRCGRETWSSRSPYCRGHRPPPEVRALWAKKTRGSRGYGAAHRALRAGVARVVEAGKAVCARCGRPILIGEDWDLDHGPGRSSYLGPSHSRCNRIAGARNGAAVTNGRRHPAQAGNVESGFVQRWSRVWSWPIPPGTYVDADTVRQSVEEEAERGIRIDPEEVRTYTTRAVSDRVAVASQLAVDSDRPSPLASGGERNERDSL